MSQSAQTQPSLDVNQDLRDRMAFLAVDAKAIAALKTIKPIVDREVPRASTPLTRAHRECEDQVFFHRSSAVQRAERLRSNIGAVCRRESSKAARPKSSRRMGSVHAELGVTPTLYIAAYGQIADHLDRGDHRRDLAQGALRGGPFARGTDAAAAISALMRVAMLDMEIGVAAFMQTIGQEPADRSGGGARRAGDAERGRRGARGARPARRQEARREPQSRPARRVPADGGRFHPRSRDCARRWRACRPASTSSIPRPARSPPPRRTCPRAPNTRRRASSRVRRRWRKSRRQIDKTAEHAQSAQVIVNQAGAEAQSNEVVAKSIAAMERIERSSNDIGKIIGAIDEIAFQTELLALNAGVEAARAGEAGPGSRWSRPKCAGWRNARRRRPRRSRRWWRRRSEVNGGVQLVSKTGEALAPSAPGSAR